jgi:hypothetical protein
MKNSQFFVFTQFCFYNFYRNIPISMLNKYSFRGSVNCQIYDIFNKTNRNIQVLHELNGIFKTNETNDGNGSNRRRSTDDSLLDGLLLHYLTETAQANDEYVSSLIILLIVPYHNSSTRSLFLNKKFNLSL